MYNIYNAAVSPGVVQQIMQIGSLVTWAVVGLIAAKFNPLRPNGNYVNHLLWQSAVLHFVFIGFAWFSL
jgi:hypothetical protein